LEYGDLVHIIWDFEPLEEGSLEDIDSNVEQFLSVVGFGDSDIESFMYATGLKRLSSYLIDSK